MSRHDTGHDGEGNEESETAAGLDSEPKSVLGSGEVQSMAEAPNSPDRALVKGKQKACLGLNSELVLDGSKVGNCLWI